MRTAAGLTWLLNDGQDSAQLTVNDATGAVVRASYTPYGQLRGSTPTPMGLLGTDRGFLGKTNDPTTGLDLLEARYYNPALAHFLSTDPLNASGSATAADPYAYANSNPTSESDGSGLGASYCETSSCAGKTNVNTGGAGTSIEGSEELIRDTAAVASRAVGYSNALAAVSVGDQSPRAVAEREMAAADAGELTLLTTAAALSDLSAELPFTAGAVRARYRGAISQYSHQLLGLELDERANLLGDPAFAITSAAPDSVASYAAAMEGAADAGAAVPKFVYRQGSQSEKNMTPRQVDITGPSTFDSVAAGLEDGAFKPGAKIQRIEVAKLKLLQANPDGPPVGHVSLAPMDPMDIPEWMATRDTSVVHPYTQDVIDAIEGGSSTQNLAGKLNMPSCEESDEVGRSREGIVRLSVPGPLAEQMLYSSYWAFIAGLQVWPREITCPASRRSKRVNYGLLETLSLLLLSPNH